jgi:hypothetical protein
MSAAAAGARIASIGLVLGSVALPAAAAPTVDRVQVGRPGQEVTVGFPRETFVSVTPLAGYRAVGAFDGDSRSWRGPAFGGGGSATLDWRVRFLAAPSAAVAARRALGRDDWPVVGQARRRVPHRVGRVTVGSIPAASVLTAAPQENDARAESVVAFPLCHGLFVAATFSATSPAAELDAASGPISVRGVPAARWNRERARDALGQVAVGGYLPVGRVTARSSGRTITGIVRDCRGHAMPGIGVRLLRRGATIARTRASADGSYRFVAPGPGSYRITVPLEVTRGSSAARS